MFAKLSIITKLMYFIIVSVWLFFKLEPMSTINFLNIILIIDAFFVFASFVIGPEDVEKEISQQNIKVNEKLYASDKMNYIILIISIIILLSNISMQNVCVKIPLKEGLYYKNNENKYSLPYLYKCLGTIYDRYIPNNRINNNNPLENDKAIVIWYRYGCPDCIELKDEIMAYISELKIQNKYKTVKIFYMSTRSEIGKMIREKMQKDIKEVPSISYIDYEKNITNKDIMVDITDINEKRKLYKDNIIKIFDQYINDEKKHILGE